MRFVFAALMSQWSPRSLPAPPLRGQFVVGLPRFPFAASPAIEQSMHLYARGDHGSRTNQSGTDSVQLDFRTPNSLVRLGRSWPYASNGGV